MPQLENKPEVKDEYLWIWHAFIELHNRRQSGMSVNTISIQAMATYFDLCDIDGEERSFLFEVISIVDTKWISKKQKENK